MTCNVGGRSLTVNVSDSTTGAGHRTQAEARSATTRTLASPSSSPLTVSLPTSIKKSSCVTRCPQNSQGSNDR